MTGGRGEESAAGKWQEARGGWLAWPSLLPEILFVEAFS